MSALFPELDGEVEAQRPADARASNNTNNDTSTRESSQAQGQGAGGGPSPGMSGEVLQVGSRAVRHFARALALPKDLGPAGVCSLRSARVTRGGRARFELEGAGLDGVGVWLEPGKAERAFHATRCMSLWHEATERTDLIGRLMKQFAVRLTNVSPDILLQIATADPETAQAVVPGNNAGRHDPGDGAHAQGASGPPTVLEVEIHDSLVWSYRSKMAWRNFFEAQEQWRGYGTSIRGDVVTVHHADVECHFSSPQHGEGTLEFFHHPRGETEPRGVDQIGREILTDMDDREIIKGGDARLDAVLDGLAAAPRKPAFVVVQTSCISKVTGDDVVVSVEKLKKKSSLPVYFIANPDSVGHELVRRARAEGAFAAAPKTPGAYNLVGLPKIAGNRDLINALSACGARLNCWLLPEVDLSTIGRYMSAEVQVLYDWAWALRRYPDALEGIEMPSVTPPAPFGMARSRAWLESVAGTLGLGEQIAQHWTALESELGPAWEAARREARGYRLGFVVDEQSAARIADPSEIIGIPLLEVLREIGFGIDLLCYAPGGVAPALPEALRGPDVRMLRFATPGDLETLLGASDAVAFYSDMAFDRRLTRAGKNVFSLRDVEMGPRGALRTARRLLAACRLPFYRAYGRHLGRGFAPQAHVAPGNDDREPGAAPVGEAAARPGVA